MNQKTAITFESEETIILKHGTNKMRQDFCPRCRTNVEMLSPDVLALATGASEREIFRLIETGRIHFIESSRVFACSSCYRESLSEGQRSLAKTLPKIAEENKE